MMREALEFSHRPVLVREILDNVRVGEKGGVFVDGTLGLGGHSEAIIQRFPSISVLGIDLDAESLSLCGERFRDYGDRFMLQESSYARLDDLLLEMGIESPIGILLDTGLSSFDIESSRRGFSFSHDGPLDMRYSQSADYPTAREIINESLQERLHTILWTYGEVPWARRIASSIVRARGTKPIESTLDLTRIVKRAFGSRIKPGKINGVLAQVFQAFRYAVNGELEVLEAGLRKSIDVLASGGRLFVICYESLSHRLTKKILREEERGCVCPIDFPVCVCGRKPRIRILTRRAIHPSDEEKATNVRSRSAFLRIAEKL